MITNCERTVVIASGDTALRRNLGKRLTDLRWRVLEASGGAEAIGFLEEQSAEVLLFDNWLPDLEVSAFCGMLKSLYPKLTLFKIDGGIDKKGSHEIRYGELLHTLRDAYRQSSVQQPVGRVEGNQVIVLEEQKALPTQAVQDLSRKVGISTISAQEPSNAASCHGGSSDPFFPGMIGQGTQMRDLVNLIRLVAPYTAQVLIEGETGTGKELVAKAIHSLSPRQKKPFIVLNCAAIPEALLEAELFGYTRGAFTGATQSRTGRIEAAHGGTLFLDEIGEMPTALQAKLLRFLENGELQRIGDNESVRVDVRVISATHQDLDQCVADGRFRLDLLHRLAVFPIEVPSLKQRMEDLQLLAEHFLSEFGKEMPRKKLSAEALASLYRHDWPGNVRELGHVLQRAVILTGPRTEITPTEIRVRRSLRA